MDELIYRPEIAKMAGISISKLQSACTNKDLNTPKYKKKHGQKFLYSKQEWIDWLEENDIKKMNVDRTGCIGTEDSARPINKKMALQFISDKTSKPIRDYLLICKKKRGKS